MRLFMWIEKGYRERDAVDCLFDEIRILPRTAKGCRCRYVKTVTATQALKRSARANPPSNQERLP